MFFHLFFLVWRPAWCWCLDAQRAVASGQHTHTTHDALRRTDILRQAGDIESLKYLPDHPDPSIRRRTYLRVPLTAQEQPNLVTWLMQCSHIKRGGKDGPSWLV